MVEEVCSTMGTATTTQKLPLQWIHPAKINSTLKPPL
jgi:hypothetical protein